jgi:hypothetical protein
VELKYHLKSYFRKSVLTITTIAVAVTLFGVAAVTAVGTGSKVLAASATVSIDLINYGGDSTTIDNTIINAHPAFIVDNSPAGPWKGNANISTFMSAGIKYFEYLDGGYEGTVARSIPNDLTSNLNYITAAANAGAYGIFLDEVSSNPNSASLSYLQQIYNKAHSLGLKVVFNTGVDSWSDSLMSYCDYINSSEVWNNAPLTASQTKWASRTWLLTQGVNDATTAANLTKEAWADGILAEYACSSYESIPSWLPTYYSLISGSSPVVTAPTIVTTTLANGTVGAAYSQTLAVTGGTAPYTWSITAGTLPAGLTLSTGGVISGTPSASCSAAAVTCQVTDSLNNTAKQSLSITVNSSITTTTPTAGNTTGVVASKPAASGAANEYNLYLKISSTTVAGLTVGQQVWCAASTTDFPNLLTVGAILTGNLDNSPGWWTFKAVSATVPLAVTAPSVTTGSATAITSSGATINGSLVSLGSVSSVNVSFNWGLTTSYGSTTTVQTLTAGGNFGVTLTGLAPNTTYHFRTQVTGSSTVYGSDNTFTTAAATVITISGNTTGVVVSKPVASGGANEYCFYLKITSTTVAGLTAGQQVWCAATTTSFPNLLTVGSTITGTLSNSPGWWVIK